MYGRRSSAESPEDLRIDQERQPREISALLKYVLVDWMEFEGFSHWRFVPGRTAVISEAVNILVVHLLCSALDLTHNTER